MNISLEHAFWYLSRTSGIVAFVLLWLSTVYGLLLTNRLAKAWPGGPAAFDLHEFTSLLSLVFTGFHVFILLGDAYMGYSLAQLLLPFNSTNYMPLWVGIGQIGFYLMLLVSITFYLRNRMKPGLWRTIHLLSFAGFALSLGHGIFSGSDSSTWWASAIYWIAGLSTVFLTVYRILVRRAESPATAKGVPAK
jgi:predicted ferric reductase